MKNIAVLGIDLAKDVFQLHGVNEHGKKDTGRHCHVNCSATKCKIVMEACGSSNYLSRKFFLWFKSIFYLCRFCDIDSGS